MSAFETYAPYTVYTCLIGSHAYGLHHERSDTDTRGIFLPPADLHWSLAGVPEQVEHAETDTVYWELGKFLRLALKANPTILECLWTPMPLQVTPIGRELLEMRSTFLSKRVIDTYRGYAIAQWKRLEHSRTHATDEGIGVINWKHAMHTLRLLIAGESALRHGEVQVDVKEKRGILLAIRAGQWKWEAVDDWRRELVERLEDAVRVTRLPDEPDTARANAFLVRARRWAFYNIPQAL